MTSISGQLGTRVGLAALVLSCCCLRPGQATDAEGRAFLVRNAAQPGVFTLESGLQYKVIKSGAGPRPLADTPCDCNYEGKRIDGTVFDSSYERGTAASFAPNQVIPGWTEAMQLMREGDEWQLFVPSELAYGDRGAGRLIRPGDALVFRLELLKVHADKSSRGMLHQRVLGLPLWAILMPMAGMMLYSAFRLGKIRGIKQRKQVHKKVDSSKAK